MAFPSTDSLQFGPAQPILAILTGRAPMVTETAVTATTPTTVEIPTGTTLFSPENANTLDRLLAGTARLARPTVAPLPETRDVSIYGDITLWPPNISVGIQSKSLNDPSEPPTLYGVSVGASSPQEPQHLAGLELALFPDRQGNVYGAQIGLSNAADEVDGLALGIVNQFDTTNGAAISLLNRGRTNVEAHINGLALATANISSINGVGVGVANMSRSESYGLLLGAYNFAGHVGGVQIGIMANESYTHTGLSVGFINTTNSPKPNNLFQVGVLNVNSGWRSFLLGIEWED